MADFSKYYPVLLKHEGGYCHTPGDSGGETYKGIARAYNPGWSGWATVDALKKKLKLQSPLQKTHWDDMNRGLGADVMLADSVKQFYKAQYWNPLRLDQFESQSVAEQLADMGVNAGITRPAKMLQYLLATEFNLKIQVDGAIGAITVRAANEVSAKELYAKFIALRRAFYDYRAQAWEVAEQGKLARWHAFFRDMLYLTPNPTQRKFLASWRSRTTQPFVS